MRDEKELLQLLGNAFITGDVQELLPALTGDCKYSSHLSGFESFGKDAIVEKWAGVNKQPVKHLYFFEVIPRATVIRDVENLPEIYKGEYCIKLSIDTPDDLLNLVFIKVDKNGFISEIFLSRDSRYTFIDVLLKDSPLLLDGTQVLPIDFKSIGVDNNRIIAEHKTGTSGFLIIRK